MNKPDNRVWSLWDMLELKVGRLLYLHERLTSDRGFFDRARADLEKMGEGEGAIRVMGSHFQELIEVVSETEEITGKAKLTSTHQAASTARSYLLHLRNRVSTADLNISRQGCAKIFVALMSIVGRMRDDCAGRIYYQIAPDALALLEPDRDHFGPEVSKAFGGAAEDISEAASCLALERSTACVFHLMRALEVAVQVIANKIGATITDASGKTLPWGVIADNMKPIIDKMRKGSEEQIKWYRTQQSLEVVNRAWRVPTAHPKQTYTSDEARRVFDATRDFMNELAPLA